MTGKQKAVWIMTVATVAIAITAVVTLCKRKASSFASIQQSVADDSVGVVNTGGGDTVVHTGTGNVTIGITLEQYEAGLKRREEEVIWSAQDCT